MDTYDYSNLTYENELKTQSAKEEYSPILEIEQSALGRINITDINFHEPGFTNWTFKYPELEDDFESEALKMTYLQTKFVKHVAPATFENYNEEKILPYPTNVRINEW